MSYTKRTCNNCGIRNPQPQMYQKEVYVETGKSKAGISGATVAGVFLGDKKSANSLNRWMFNTNQRTYKRKKTVWLCRSCSGNNAGTGAKILISIIKYIFILIFFFVVIAFLGNAGAI